MTFSYYTSTNTIEMTAQLVLPGESLQIPSSSSITLGPGIAAGPSSSTFISTKLGLLRSSAGQKSSKGKEKGTSYWVESNTKRVSYSVLCVVSDS
jgi:hypothetical protein